MGIELNSNRTELLNLAEPERNRTAAVRVLCHLYRRRKTDIWSVQQSVAMLFSGIRLLWQNCRPDARWQSRVVCANRAADVNGDCARLAAAAITSCAGGRHNMPPPLWPWPFTFWPWKWCPSRVWRVGYLCADFSLSRPLCSRLRPDVRDRQTDVRRVSSLNASA